MAGVPPHPPAHCQGLILPRPSSFAMELVTEKGHTFAEELQKVSNVILAHNGALCPCGLRGGLLASR